VVLGTRSGKIVLKKRVKYIRIWKKTAGGGWLVPMVPVANKPAFASLALSTMAGGHG
jgi:hypothetical protein